MPRAIWNGAVSFGLVNIPIKLVTAVDRKKVSFREIRRSDSSRIRHRKVASADGEEVAQDEIVKGYEIAPDRYVVIDPSELRSLDPKASRTIEISDFVDLADVDPIFYDASYYLVPGETAAKPYKLLHTAMVESGKAAVAKFVLRTKEYLAIVRPLGDALSVSTLVFADEVIGTDRLEGLPDDDVELTDKELDMARQLIASMEADWEPDRYHDEYRERVLEMIERKADGEEVVSVPDDEKEAGDVVDLMAALEKSLESKKARSQKKAAKKSKKSA